MEMSRRRAAIGDEPKRRPTRGWCESERRPTGTTAGMEQGRGRELCHYARGVGAETRARQLRASEAGAAAGGAATGMSRMRTAGEA